jgi:hypothetical protein
VTSMWQLSKQTKLQNYKTGWVCKVGAWSIDTISVWGGDDGLQHHGSTDPVARGLGLVTSMWKLSKQTKLHNWLCL